MEKSKVEFWCRMKTRTLILSLFVAGTVPLLAEDTNALPDDLEHLAGLAASEVRSNIYLVVFNKDREHPVGMPTDRPIWFGLVSTNGVYYSVNVLKPEFGFRISAVSESGREVKKKRAGAKWGKEFATVEKWDKKYYAGLTQASPHFPPRTQLPPLDNLFKFNQPGKYLVSLEVQVVSRPLHGPQTNKCLVKLPPVKFDVVKPEPE